MVTVVKTYALTIDRNGTLQAICGKYAQQEESDMERTPANEVDRRVKIYMREKGEKDYATALRAVLSADPELRDAYAS